MIDGSEKRNRQLAFEFHNSRVFEKRSNLTSLPRNAQKQQFPALFSPLTCKCLLVGSSYSERPSPVSHRVK